jgi:hypothetical protein
MTTKIQRKELTHQTILESAAHVVRAILSTCARSLACARLMTARSRPIAHQINGTRR